MTVSPSAERSRHAALTAVARSHERAEILAQAITEEGGRAEALARVAAAMAAQGLHDRAARLAGESELLARAVTSPDRQAEAVINLSFALAEAGLHDRARHVASKAADVVHSVSDPSKRSYMLAFAAATASDSGLEEQAAQLADGAESTARLHKRNPDNALVIVAWVLAGCGLHDRAVATALTRAGAYEDAERLASEAQTLAWSLSRPEERAEPPAHTAKAFAAIGRYQQATSTAQSITDSEERASALLSIAAAHIRAGQHDQALSVAQSIDDPRRKSDALSMLAKACTVAGDDRRARHIMAEALANGQWTRMVSTLGSLSPDALIALTTRLLDE